MIKKTFEELRELDSMVGSIDKSNPDFAKTKLRYAYKRFAEKYSYKIFKQFDEEIIDARVDNALTDDKGAIVEDPKSSRGFAFSKKGYKAIVKLERDISKKWDSKIFEVEPFIVKAEDIPKDLTEEQLEVFKGILIK